MLPLYLLERVHAHPSAPLSLTRSLTRSIRLRHLHSTPPHLAAPAPPPSGNKDKGKGKAKDGPAHAHQASLLLPRTGFPLRADAAKRERLFWDRTTDELYKWQSQQKDRPVFVLHDGPPYANGNLHTGHALNKITKDIINRSKLLQGYRIHYTPGFDTHGLPLELKALSALKKPAASLSPQEIRAAARKEAEKGVAVQTAEFRAFASLGAWGEGESYKTMEWKYERRQLEVVREMVRKGLIVSHNRPTLYSPSSRTALAEAELEYREDHKSRSVYVAFPVADSGRLDSVMAEAGVAGEKVNLAVWTTTAWTLPSNVAIAVSETMDYTLARLSTDDSLLVLASARLSALEEILGATLTILATFAGSALLQTTFTSPLSSTAHVHTPRPLIPASYVTATTGTGLVHTAPAHGVEDFQAWRAFQSARDPSQPPADVVCAVDGLGKISDAVDSMVEPDVRDRLVGKEVLGDATGEVIEILKERGTLLREVEVEHKFPYDWRTKKPVIFRASNQWFANLENVKEDAVKAMEAVEFHPSRGRQTLEMFVRGRSEWCISRQRAWGVPLPIVYSYPKGSADPIAASTPYLTPSNVDHIISVLDQHTTGTDYWWDGPAEAFVVPAELERSRAEGKEWRKGLDTMDVWFDSGCSWTLLREEGIREEAEGRPLADVYLEGSDQHRGWFQSSLLTKISATGEGEKAQAPYGTVITHGMVLDEKGRKMSKSLGNVLSPFTVINGGKNMKQQPAYGTDLLRVWVASVDSTRDVLIGPAILAQTSDALRKIRNTARFMLGNLHGQEAEHFLPEQLSLTERFIMHELFTLDKAAREGYNAFTFNKVHQSLSAFSNTTLSSFYFDIIKDSLYADASSSPTRLQVAFVLQRVLETYTAVLAPMAPLLAEEIHHFAKHGRDPEKGVARAGSVFEHVWKQVGPQWESEEVAREMGEVVEVREEVMGLLEKARVDKLVGTSTEAEVYIEHPTPALTKHAAELARLFIVADVHLGVTPPPVADAGWSLSSEAGSAVVSAGVTVRASRKGKCSRCWTYALPVGTTDEVCARCRGVLEGAHGLQME